MWNFIVNVLIFCAIFAAIAFSINRFVTYFPEAAKKVLTILSGIFLAIVVLAGIGIVGGFMLWLGLLFKSDSSRPLPRPIAHAVADSVKTKVVYVVERARSMQVFDSIPPQGLQKYLRQGWQDFPLYGAITIQRLDETGKPTGPVLHDEPGVSHDFGFQQDGIYIIRADPEGSRRGVQLYNQW